MSVRVSVGHGQPDLRPFAPQVSATPVSSSRIDLAWPAIHSAASYRVHVSDTPGFVPGPVNLVRVLGAPGYSITGLAAGTTRYARVVAVNRHGSIASDEVSATTAAPVLGTITDLSATALVESVRLDWTAAANATSHQPQYSDDGETWEDFGDPLGGEATGVTVTGLTADVEYTFRVIASDGSTQTISNTDTATPTEEAIFFTEGFDDTSFADRDWYDNTDLTTTSDETVGDGSSLAMAWAQGQTLPTMGAAARRLFPETEKAYVSFWVKYSANWQGSGEDFHPHIFQLLTNLDGPFHGPAQSHLTAYIESCYQAGGSQPVLGLQDRLNINESGIGQDLTNVTEDRAVAGCNGDTDGYPTGCWLDGSYWNEKKWVADEVWFSDTPGSRYKNDWHFVEVFFEMNSIQGGIGIPDGRIRYWYDGQLAMDVQDVLFRTGANPSMRFNQFLIGPYIGAGSPVAQTIWIDDLTVANYRVGVPATSEWPNAPAGWTTMVDLDPTAIPLPAQPAGGFNYSSQWSSNVGSGIIAVDEVAGSPVSPPRVLRWTYAQGRPGGDSPGRAVIESATMTFPHVYLGFYARWSDPWDHHGTGVDKIIYFGERDGSTGSFYLSRESNNSYYGSDALPVIGMTLQYAQNYSGQPGGADSQRRFPRDGADERLATTPLTNGEWHLIELIMNASTDGLPNGRSRCWVNGVLQWDIGNMRYNATRDARFCYLNMDPVWGGGGDTKAQADTLEFAHVLMLGSEDT